MIHIVIIARWRKYGYERFVEIGIYVHTAAARCINKTVRKHRIDWAGCPSVHLSPYLHSLSKVVIFLSCLCSTPLHFSLHSDTLSLTHTPLFILQTAGCDGFSKRAIIGYLPRVCTCKLPVITPATFKYVEGSSFALFSLSKPWGAI